MNKIKILPVHLVNKIAAGECIERPASVVKELVENAIDAGASKIEVFLEQGGCKLIRVCDDGGGIDPGDMVLAVPPPATSQLQDENALYAISSMGFRGEALTSIASVALLKIFSVQPGKDSGATIEVNGGQMGEVTPCAGAPGTTIEVQNIFFNTPARRKFLKTPATELGHCQEALTRLALAFPRIGFNLYHGSRQLLQLPPAESPRQRIADIFGHEIADDLVQVFTQTREITFSAYVCRPEQAKNSASWQYFFVNRRTIRDRYVAHALREAYRGLMPPDRQPIGFLYLEIDPSIVDVNVHPTKSEVRFADSGLIHSLILGAIRERFLSTDLTQSLRVGEGKAAPAEAQEHQQRIKDALKDFFKSAGSTSQSRITFSPPKSPSQMPISPTHSSSTERKEPPIEQPHLPHTESEPVSASTSQSQDEPSQKTPVLQIHNSYLVVETADGLMIVDQHALHERVLYQQLRAKIGEGAVLRQRLLVPDVVTLTPQQMTRLYEIRDSLARAGIEVEPFGPQSIAIHSLPAIIRQINAAEFMEELLGRLGEAAKVEPEFVLEQVLQSLACKAAIKAGDPLKPEDIQALLDYRQQIDMSSSCPHGRPTALQMSLADLQKQFKRT